MEPDEDERISWLASRVCSVLGVKEEAWDTLLSVDNGANAQRLADWLDASGPRPAIVFQATTVVLNPEPSPTAPHLARSRSSRGAAKVPETLDEGSEDFEGAPALEDSSAGAPGASDAPDGAQPSGPATAPDAPATEGAPLADGPASEPAGEGGEAAPGSERAPLVDTPPPGPTTFSTLYLAIGPEVQFALAERPEAEGIYFTLLTDEPLVADKVEDIDEFMFDHVSFGSVAGGQPTLVAFERLLQQVYLPLISQPPAYKGGRSGMLTSASNIGGADGPEIANLDFVNNLSKFVSQVTHAIQQVTGDFRLNIPTVHIDDPQRAVDNFEVVTQIESALEEWTPAIAALIEQQQGKTAGGKGPLAEIEFWRARNAALSTISEQLSTPNVRRMLEVLEASDSGVLPNFKFAFGELQKLSIEAKDNVKFLTTLERHFKTISQAGPGSLTTIIDTLPSMMNAIRMVWVISRHYNTDERMVPLMVRIAWEIANKVATVISVKTIFREPAPQAIRKIQDARACLEKWNKTYLAVREKIELSGRDQRWEFDKKRLFDRTNYMRDRCADLAEVAEVLDNFHSILGSELKQVTGDAQGIDEVIAKVDGLVVPLETVPFDIFDKRYQTSWESVMAKFRSDVEQIEENTKSFMDTSFKKLRSAEGAFDLLCKFRNIQSRDAIKQQMEQKIADILAQFEKEVDKHYAIFTEHKDAPPISKNQPPVAGAISWSHSLFLRIRQSMAKFQSMEELYTTEQGKSVNRRFVAVSKEMRHYQQALFSEWRESVNSLAMKHLKEHILIEEPTGKLAVNFSTTLSVLIRESKYLDRMGFPVPETALNVTLQEEKYYVYVESLTAMLEYHANVLASLSPVEKNLLQAKVAGLRATLQKGCELLNWNSLSIPEFVKSSTDAIKRFESLSKQIQKKAHIIKGVVDSISRAQVVQLGSGANDAVSVSAEVPELQELYDEMERTRLRVTEELAQKYHQISPLLMKVEEEVVGTSTGRSPQMREYYVYWEGQLFQALNKMVIHGLSKLLVLLQSYALQNENTDSYERRPPLFRVGAILSTPEVVVSPPLNDINKLLIKLVRSIAENTRQFVRWMDGTCIETAPQIVNEDEDPVIFSFYPDVSANVEVAKLQNALISKIQQGFARINKFLDVFRRYDTLWKKEKRTTLEKFAQRNPSCVKYDKELVLKRKIVTEISAMPTEKDLDFVRITVGQLVREVVDHAQLWIDEINFHLHMSVKQRLPDMVGRISDLSASMDQEPESLDELKFVLNVISEVRTNSMDMELEYTDIAERYRTLRMYDYSKFEEGEVEMVDNLRARCEQLLVKAQLRDKALDSVKSKFTKVTEDQVSEFAAKAIEVQADFEKNGPGAPGINMEEGLERLEQYTVMIAEHQKRREELALAQKLFNMPIQSYPELSDVEQTLKKLQAIFDLYKEQRDTKDGWSGTLWSELDSAVLEKGMEGFAVRLKGMVRQFGQEIKADRRTGNAYKMLEDAIIGFLDSLPLIQNLKSEALRDRHWKKLMKLTGISFDMNPKTFTLGKLFSMQLEKYSEQIAELTGAAIKELTIERGINDIADTWHHTRFEVAKYVKGGTERGFVLKSTDEIQLTLEDQMMNLSSMSASRFVGPFLDQTQKWEKLMSTIAEVIEVWMKVQSKWMYLEAIFVGSEDIRLQLPEEAKRFDRIHTTFKKIMSDTNKNPSTLEACTLDGRLEALQGLLHQLEACQKSLSDYLETKRTSFPRFYFLSDDELLSILGTSDPTSVQEHMLKLFDNTAALKFDRTGGKVLGMVSSEKESFDFDAVQTTEGAVETWLLTVEKEMMRTLNKLHKEGTFFYAESDRIEWIKRNLGMVVNTAAQIWWTWESEDTFNRVRLGGKAAMKTFAKKCSDQLDRLIQEVQTESERLMTKKINTLIIIDLHSRDIVDTFVRDSILDAREFAWESQLRFYWDRDEDDVSIGQCSGSFLYGYEYQGLSGRLVITPLTDRCYMTMTQALSYRLGTAPAGPAGTGKTETVKDLAKAMALQCVVFNCGEGLDYKAMGSIFSGLVQCGAWGCFDEFNRIDAEVLSVVSAQIKTIQNACLENLKRFTFESREIALNPRVGIFITMNPGYAGRTELPDNLKALFRPVTMVVPNLELICMVMLMSQGFITAKVLAKKMTTLYKLAKEQLSKQYHYDFGLRALKSVLVMAGDLKRSSPDLSEATILMRALRDMNMPKFVYEDVPLFKGLIKDLFPGLDTPRVRYASFNDAVDAALVEPGHQFLEVQADKVVQLYETMLTRHTTMVVGPTGGGKTVILDTLARAQNALDVPTKMHILNPKAQSVLELYGVLDPATRDWTDGLLSNIFREMNRPLPLNKDGVAKDERRYIVYDGDVDAVWVENMNSVMDDNKLLTLPNGERIRLNYPTCCMLFEVFDLQYASPATISRCGMVYVDPKDLGYKPFLDSWLKRRARDSAGEAEVLTSLIEKYLGACIGYVVEGIEDREKMVIVDPLRQIVPRTDLGLVMQLTRLLEGMLTAERAITEPPMLEAIFLLCLTWSVGGALVQEARLKFDKFLKKLSGFNVNPSETATCGPGQLPGFLPTLHDYLFDPEERRWVPWNMLVPAYVPPADGKFSSIVVPTSDTVRTSWLLETVVNGTGTPILLVGESGTAKTTIVRDFIQTQAVDKTLSLTINFSSRTSARDVQNAIEDTIEKRTKDTFGPPAGKRLLIFVDDLNMPRVDKYGTQQPIALLKLLLDKGFMYDRKELTLKYIKDIQSISAMAPPGGARAMVDPRFVNLFSVFSITFPPESSIRMIYSTILEQHFNGGIFDPAISGASLATKLTSASLELFNAITAALPATPSKFHYVFNLRDLSRVTEGLMQSTPDRFTEPKQVVRLWRHEVLRCFYDRLVGKADKEFVNAKIGEILHKDFTDHAVHALEMPILFGDFMKFNEIEEAREAKETTDEVRLVEDLVSYDAIKIVLDNALERYNLSHKAMNMVLFDDCLDHLVRVHRILRLPRGNALLVGVGGSGKQSITRLAAHVANCDVFEITLTRGYSESNFRDDLKTLYGMLPDRGVAFLFTDAHVAEEGFLELINNLLAAGIVPALYEEAERDSIINNIRDEVTKKGLPDSKDAVWQYFVNKCRDNLHIVLAMSPIGETLRVRCRSFPGMINNTVIDWFVPWPHQALLSVAGVFLSEEQLPDATRGDIIEHMVLVQESVMKMSDTYEVQLKRYNYVTPKNYLDFISNYKRSLKEERKKIDTQVARLDGGLQKLIQAAKEVDVMSEKLKVAKAEVDIKSKEVKEMLEVISENTAKAEAKKAEATQREAELEVSSQQISVEKAEAEQALEAAIPALEDAANALKSLNKDDITEIRSFANPHDLVRKVCECVYVLKGLGIKPADLSWKASKGMMSQMDFLQSLIDFDKDAIQEKQIKKVKESFQDPAFTVANVSNISKAGGGLLKWVYAIVNYHGVAKTVNPKRQAVANAEKALRQAQKDLAKIKKDVVEIEELLRDLGEKYETGTAEESDLTHKAETMERQLIAASQLISGLGSERERWTKDIGALKEKRVMLIGDCLLAAAFLSYTGAFNFDFRRQLMKDTWEVDLREKQVPVTADYRIETLLTSEVETAKWASEGLPPDELSIQNGILTNRASRYPLCIDPQQQAVIWIKRREAKSNLKVCTFNDPDFLKHLEIAVNLGFSFLFEGVDEYIDPIIDPVLEKNIVKRGNSRTVKLGDKDVEWDDSFTLYLTSKLSNPHYGPETFGKAMIINYSVTLQGLEDQLLNVVVEHERKDLADQRTALIQDMSDLSETLKELEDSLLYELANSTGNILDNTDLISTLEQTKTKATEISAKLELAKVTSVEIDEACSHYRSVATRGSILFFVMASLAALNNMYELSLALYMVVFGVALDKADSDPILEHRLENMTTTLTKDCYNYTCMGIFETHKLMFSFQMCISILEGQGELNRAELDFFLKGNLSLEKSEAPPHAWIPEKTWHDVMRLTTIGERFKELATAITSDGDKWQKWYDLDNPEVAELPSGLSQKLDRLEQMCVLRCFRVDRVYIATTKFVEHHLGGYYVSPPVLEYSAIFHQSTETTPIVFILSPGADPASDIFKLATRMGMDKKLKFMALGQGQGPIAASMLDMGAQRGHWVMLQNCHLLPSWLKTLEKLLLQLTRPHADFRLWLTTEPTDKFPIGILQRSIKVVTEPPNGLRLNMMSSYSKVTEENLQHCPHPAYRSTVFVLAFLHAVVQERRKYGKVGWNVRYDFNDSDFRVSLMLLDAYLTKAFDNDDPQIPWDTLRYLTGEVMYGGRVTDDLDRRVLTTYLHEYFGDFLFDTFQPFHFFKNAEVDYRVPQSGHRDVYIKAIQAMPAINSPEVFGLHPNAEINYLTHASKKLWADLLDLQPRQAATSGEMSREQYIDKVASDILTKMPPSFDVNRIKKEAEGDLTPTFIVLAQELERWEHLCSRMGKTLKELRRAIAGEVGMSTELDALGSNLYNGQLPDMWRKLTPQTEKMLGPWMVFFLRRHKQYKSWIDDGEPKVIWLSGLHIPETYTAALVQTTCRKYKWALDKSTLYTSITKMVDESEVLVRPDDGCFVQGLYMEGAALDVERSVLVRQAPKVLVQELPIMQIIPIELAKLKLQGTIRVPMYITQERKNAMGVGLMMEADVRTVDHVSHWVLQGVAITLNVDT